MQKFPDHIAIDYIPAYLAGKASAEEVAIVEVWINGTVENRVYFESLKKTWEETGKLEPIPVMVDVDKSWDKLNTRIEAGENKVIFIGRRKRITTMGILLRVAAVLIPILFLAWLYFWQNGKNRQMELITSVSVLQDTLPDGTMVTLNNGSKLSFPEKFRGSKREVKLEGEAYFNVTPDKEKPFIIHSGDANIRVLGTSFNVNAYKNKDEVEVLVKEGKVLLYGNDKSSGDTNSVVLAAGEKGFFNKLTSKVRKVQDESLNELFWKTKTLIFSKTELSMVVETLQKFYGVNIVLSNKELLDCRLSATFVNQPIDNIVDIIAKSFNLTITKNGTTYNLDGKGC